MEHAFALGTFWIGLALVATFAASRLGVSNALLEICVGMAAGMIAEHAFGHGAMGADEPWVRFMAGTGSVLLTFLAGAELEPTVMRAKWKEVTTVGTVGFLAPFLGCAALARYLLGWDPGPSLLAGIALSTTSMAVVYAVMLETGLNRTEFGKGILGACFVNDLGTVIVLGLLFSPFSSKTLIFLVGCALAYVLLPIVTPKLVNHYANKTAAFRTKWVLFILFGLGALALWAGSEAVLPAYVAGMVLASSLGRDESFVRRLRTLTIGFLSPMFFLRAGSLVSIPALVGAPLLFLTLLSGKVGSKIFGLLPVIGIFRRRRDERWYYTLLMSTGLTFGTISALFGLAHGIVTQEQYSLLVAAVVASAVVPTVIAGKAFLPRHLVRSCGPVPSARAAPLPSPAEPREEG